MLIKDREKQVKVENPKVFKCMQQFLKLTIMHTKMKGALEPFVNVCKNKILS